MSEAHEILDPVATILLTDPDPMTAHLLAKDVKRQQQFRVIECRFRVRDVMERICTHQPSVLLLSVGAPEDVSGVLRVLKESRGLHPGVRAIVLVNALDREMVAALFRAGARGIFDRSEYDPEFLSRCIICVAAGQVWAKSEYLEFVLDAFAETTPLRLLSVKGDDLLTRREMDVVRLVADGFANRDVAEQLGLSVHTVKNYMFKIFNKLGISSRAELIMYVLSRSGHRAGSVREIDSPPQPRMIRSHAQSLVV